MARYTFLQHTYTEHSITSLSRTAHTRGHIRHMLRRHLVLHELKIKYQHTPRDVALEHIPETLPRYIIVGVYILYKLGLCYISLLHVCTACFNGK